MNLLITRPYEDAQRLAAPLEKLGHRVTYAPLLVAHYCLPLTWPDWSNVQGLLFTSANGVRAFEHAFRHCTQWDIMQALPTLAVGPHTAETLKGYGFASVACANGGWRTLVECVPSHFYAAKGRLLHITGTETAGHVGDALTTQGYLYERLPIYDMVSAPVLPAPTVHDFSQHRIDGVILCSSRTAQIFTSLIERAELADIMHPVTAWCLSPAIAMHVSSLPLSAVRIATYPNLPSLIDLLSQANAKPRTSENSTTPLETLCTDKRTPHDVRHY